MCGRHDKRALDHSPDSWHEMMFWTVVKEISFKAIFIFYSGGHFVQRSRTIYAILLECIIRNIYVKLI